MSDDEPDDEEQHWLAEAADHCRCCPKCSAVPCDGVAAGGFCDLMCGCDAQWDED